MMINIKNTWLYDMVGLVYPQLCCACKNRMNKQEDLICFQCLYELPKTNFHLDKENIIARHFLGRVRFQEATALYFFLKEGKVQELMHQLKYAGRYEIGVKLGKILGRQLKEAELWQGIDGIVPVPLHPQKLKKRGYNQCDAIADGLSEVLECPAFYDAVVKAENIESQTRKSKEERWQNVKTVFAIRKAEVLQGKHLLLVDDVVTTGATLIACAEQLLGLEGTKVSFATLACAKELGK